VVLFLVVCYALAGTMDYAAARVSGLMLLENSMLPASLEECERARPGAGRPARVMSKQQRTNEPWHHRTCAWNE
jgi:hypothetical protein